MGFITKEIRGKKPDISKAGYIADGCFLSGDVILGDNVNIWPNCTLRADLGSIVIGDNTNIQDNSVIHVDIPVDEDYRKNPDGHVIVGKNVTIGHSCIIHSCKIGDNCLIGMGSVIGDDCVIEDGAFVGASSNVTPRTIVKSGELWFGSPARFMRMLRDNDKEYMRKDTEIYLELAKEYKKD